MWGLILITKMKKALLLLITALCCSDGNTSEMIQDTAQLRGGKCFFGET